MALSQSDIEVLEIKEKQYLVPLGEPKELYLKIHPTGRKVFQLREQKLKKYITIGEFRKGLLNLSEARKEAIKILQQLRSGDFIDNKNKKFTLNMANDHYIETIGKKLSYFTIKKEQGTFVKYIQPMLGEKPINLLEKKDFLPIYDHMNSKNIYSTLNKSIAFICRILELARQRGELKTSIIADLKDLQKYYRLINDDCNVKHFKALVEEKEVKFMLECMKEYRQRARVNVNIINAIYFTLLTAQRSKNIRFAKWSEIDFDNNLWVIQAEDMKVKSNGENIIPLNEYALKILQMQKMFNVNKEYVFFNFDKCISDNFASKFFKMYDLKHTIHGFRSTFRSICTEKSNELIKLGIGKDIAEMILHHVNGSEVERAYNRSKAIDLRKQLMNWYGEYLNSLCPFDFK